jgi:hypothetical protein
MSFGTGLRLAQAERLTLEGTVLLRGSFVDLAFGPDGAGRVDVLGALAIDGAAVVSLIFKPTDAPLVGTRLELLTVSGPLTGEAGVFGRAVVDSPGGAVFWTPPEGALASFGWEGSSYVFSVTAVPEPGTWALWLAGGLLMCGMLRRPRGQP